MQPIIYMSTLYKGEKKKQEKKSRMEEKTCLEDELPIQQRAIQTCPTTAGVGVLDRAVDSLPNPLTSSLLSNSLFFLYFTGLCSAPLASFGGMTCTESLFAVRVLLGRSASPSTVGTCNCVPARSCDVVASSEESASMMS